MISLFLCLLGTAIPTGITGLSREASNVSPVEGRLPSFTEISLPVRAALDGNTVLIVTADYVSAPLAPQIAQLQTDLAAEGWNTSVQSMSGGTVQDLKTLLQSTPDIDGAILIGFLPCAWFEEDYWASEEFPCELYLMDLDGVWTDTDHDGMYDSHTGDVAPEIWVGRIDAHAVDFGSELLMLSEYLQKNHLYRTGAMAPPSRALAYIDDDWSSYTDCGLDYIYGSSGVTVVNSQSQTTAEGYLEELEQGYEFVHLMAHSCPWGHTFKVPSGMSGTVMAPEIAQVNPNTAFAQLFSCSNARWIETGCLGNWYLFGTDTGLLVSGAAKTGSMLDFEYFYSPVGNGSCFGEAFRDWWEYEATGGFSADERAWFYGNALLGDPTLKPVSSLRTNGVIQPAQEGTDGFQVSTSIHSDCFPDADTRDGITAVAWLTGENGRLDVAARFHDDDGDSWSQVYIVDADEYWDNKVTVCFDKSGTPWLAWSDFEYSTYSYRIKTAHGIPFENVTAEVPQEGYQVSPDLACTDRMWLAWQDWESTGGRIMVKALEGTPFETQLSEPGTWASSPAVSEGPDGSLHALWVESSPSGSYIVWCQGDENGFSTPQTISTGSFCHSPHIALCQNTLVAVWQSDGISSSVTARIWDGTQWTSETQLQNTTEHIMNPMVSSEPGTGSPLVIWQENRTGGTAHCSILSGGTWSVPFQPFYSSGPVWSPVASGERYFWAGSEGADWNIYSEIPSGVQEDPSAPAAPVMLGNPVYGALLLSLPETSCGFSGTISIMDISGRMVLESAETMNPGGTCTIDCASLPAGVYSLIMEGSMKPSRFTLLH